MLRPGPAGAEGTCGITIGLARPSTVNDTGVSDARGTPPVAVISTADVMRKPAAALKRAAMLNWGCVEGGSRSGNMQLVQACTTHSCITCEAGGRSQRCISGIVEVRKAQQDGIRGPCVERYEMDIRREGARSDTREGALVAGKPGWAKKGAK